MELTELGFDTYFEEQFNKYDTKELIPARICRKLGVGLRPIGAYAPLGIVDSVFGG